MKCSLLLAGCLTIQFSSATQITMSNKHLRVGAVPYPPFLVIETDKHGRAKYSGMIWDLIELIQETRNCTFEVMIPTDLRWGKCYGINNCTGMIGMVNRKEVDFALGSKDLSKLFLKKLSNLSQLHFRSIRAHLRPSKCC